MSWKERSTLAAEESVIFALIPPLIGISSTNPVATERTIFVHTLGTKPLLAHNGKLLHAKELGLFYGLGAPVLQNGTKLPTYYGSGAHDGRTKYIALDGADMCLVP